MDIINRIFTYEDYKIKVYVTSIGEPWFCGRYIAKVLLYKDTKKALEEHVDDDFKLTLEELVRGNNCPYRFRGNEAKAIYMNEAGLYSLIFRSKMPKAKEFKRWVTSEVLSSIRKTWNI